MEFDVSSVGFLRSSGANGDVPGAARNLEERGRRRRREREDGDVDGSKLLSVKFERGADEEGSPD